MFNHKRTGFGPHPTPTSGLVCSRGCSTARVSSAEVKLHTRRKLRAGAHVPPGPEQCAAGGVQVADCLICRGQAGLHVRLHTRRKLRCRCSCPGRGRRRDQSQVARSRTMSSSNKRNVVQPRAQVAACLLYTREASAYDEAACVKVHMRRKLRCRYSCPGRGRRRNLTSAGRCLSHLQR